MGTIQHDAILITMSDLFVVPDTLKIHYRQEEGDFRLIDHLEHLAQVAGLGDLVLKQEKQSINGYRTLVIVPDGSKEYWTESDDYNRARESFLESIKDLLCTVIVVSYGDLGNSVKELEDNV